MVHLVADSLTGFFYASDVLYMHNHVCVRVHKNVRSELLLFAVFSLIATRPFLRFVFFLLLYLPCGFLDRIQCVVEGWIFLFCEFSLYFASSHRETSC